MLNLLIKLGLDENEAKIYLALLELGPALVTEIGQKADVGRTTCYDVLERLVKHNLVTYASGQAAKRKYSAMPPHNLVGFLERKHRQQEKQLVELKEKMPELKMLYKETERPTVKFFEGVEGVKSIYAETLKAKGEILSVGDCEEWDTPELSVWGANYNRQRSKLKIKERVIIPAGEKTINWFIDYPTTKKYTEFRILPKEKINYLFYSEINIYDDKVVIALLKRPNRLGIMITSRQFANLLRALFEMAWLAAEKYPGEKYGKELLKKKNFVQPA
ncbi:MAG: helix-turn-helix domain-containing protein [Patescibacteria group bacterium]|nr:helix-turn-helix domain-containing protein [Patescibacteria group bacterium]